MMQAQVQCVQWLQVEVQGEKGAYLVGVWGVCFARGKRAATMLRREEEEERRRWCRRVAQSMREGDGSARGCGEGICAWAMRWKEGDGDGGMGLVEAVVLSPVEALNSPLGMRRRATCRLC
ncbi:hypothetical protein AAC387_Pa12g0336 [Persea americana]